MSVVEQVVPTSPKDEINRTILEISEDQIRGFVRNPIAEIAYRSGLNTAIVAERVQAMLKTGVIRRVRQTLQATNLAQGALIAWKITPEKAAAGFDFIADEDPFSGHVVIRRSEFGATDWPLWTTLKVPAGFSIEKHCDYLRDRIGAERHFLPIRHAVAVGVGISGICSQRHFLAIRERIVITVVVARKIATNGCRACPSTTFE